MVSQRRTHVGGGGEDIRLRGVSLGLAVLKVVSDWRVSNWMEGRCPCCADAPPTGIFCKAGLAWSLGA